MTPETATELAALRAEVEKNNRIVLALAQATVAMAVLLEQLTSKVEDLTIDSLMQTGGHKSMEKAIEDAVAEVVRRRKVN